MSEQMTFIEEMQNELEKKIHRQQTVQLTPEASERPSIELKSCINWIAFASEIIADFLKIQNALNGNKADEDERNNFIHLIDEMQSKI